MVLSEQPDQPFKTSGELGAEPVSCASHAAPEPIFEPNVRGPLEQVVPMQSRTIVWRNTVFHYGKNVFRLGVAPMLACGAGSAMLPTVAHAQSAASWNKRGVQAEAREDFDAAFEDYRQAHLKKPRDLRYRERYERLRFQAANVHVDRGRVLRQSGDISGAINEFARALQIDPGFR
jgi:general secretion pathway protein D